MKELIEYRQKIIERLAEDAHKFRAACEAVKDPFAILKGKWTLHQIASHTRDVDQLIYGKRVMQTLNEDHPRFVSFDADAWMAAHYNKDEPLAKILDEFVGNVENLCRILRDMPMEAWSRESTHETIGDGLTLQLWVEQGLAHIEEHLEPLKKSK